ncbi:DNA polymerase ligase N-terminal domain-containing protein [Pseudomonas putida]|uniref:DNA polymerase ligase N-terminal domain-containing protein n=1 Tax=Pseudomonas putida TaxID=303 RepID=UPI003A7F201E
MRAKHDAIRFHYDLRLELSGKLKSWALPKGPCFGPKVTLLSVHVEDHRSSKQLRGYHPKSALWCRRGECVRSRPAYLSERTRDQQYQLQ